MRNLLVKRLSSSLERHPPSKIISPPPPIQVGTEASESSEIDDSSEACAPLSASSLVSWCASALSSPEVLALSSPEEASNETLHKLNATLVAALRDERARSQKLEAALVSAREEPLERATSVPLQRAASADGLRPMRALRRLSSTGASSNKSHQPPSASAFGSKVGRRSTKRVVVDPLGAPLRAGALVPAAVPAAPPVGPPASVTATSACEALGSASDSAAPPDSPPWPEPVESPPSRARVAPRWPRDWQQPGATGTPGVGGAGDGSSRARQAPVLSAGLAAVARRALRVELGRLQQTLQATLTQAPPPPPMEFERTVRSLARRLGWLRSDLALLAAHTAATTSDAEAAGSDRTGSEAAAPPERPDGVVGAARGGPPPVTGQPQQQQQQQTDADVDAEADSLASLYSIACSAEEFATSLRRELQASAAAVAERERAERLCERAGWRLVPIAHDGDCLFTCAYTWLTSAIDTARSPSSVGGGNVAGGEGGDASDAITGGGGASADSGAGDSGAADGGGGVPATHPAVAVAELCAAPSDVRALTMDLMRERVCGAPSAAADVTREEDRPTDRQEDELGRRIDTLVGAALSGGAKDATSVALRQAMREALRASPTLGGEAAARRVAYLQTMGRAGIFGERLEIEVLASLLCVPIHIHYSTAGASGSDADEATQAADSPPTPPKECVIPEGVSADAEPLRLMHLLNERHFDLILPGAVPVL